LSNFSYYNIIITHDIIVFLRPILKIEDTVIANKLKNFKMKKLIILLTITACILSCSVRAKPEFLRVENIEVAESNSQFIVLTADAFFNNPNSVGGKLETEGIVITVNNIEVATVSSKEFDVPAKKEFLIPLSANIPTNKVLNLNNLSSVLSSMLSKTMKVQYKGVIKYKVFGFSHNYDIDEIEDVKIKL